MKLETMDAIAELEEEVGTDNLELLDVTGDVIDMFTENDSAGLMRLLAGAYRVILVEGPRQYHRLED